MSTLTPIYNLIKPDASDEFNYFRALFNTNMDIIDQNLGGGGGGGSVVTYTQTLSSGTKTGAISINGVSTDMYAPTPPAKVSDLTNDSGFTSTSWSQIQQTGTKIAEISIDGVSQDVYAPTSGGGSGNVDDVKVNGTSVVDANKVAQITSYEEVTQSQYDALPSSKLTDGIAYFIKDAVTPQYASEDLIAPVLSTFFATNDINTKGQHFIYGGVLYEITTTVTSGTAFVVSSNVKVADSVEEQIEATNADLTTLHKKYRGTPVDLTAYTSTSNSYTFPCDGYVTASATASSSYYRVRVTDPNSNNLALLEGAYTSSSASRQSVFVRANMKGYVSAKGGTVQINFMPLV